MKKTQTWAALFAALAFGEAFVDPAKTELAADGSLASFEVTPERMWAR
jgi:hypothetical protein